MKPIDAVKLFHNEFHLLKNEILHSSVKPAINASAKMVTFLSICNTKARAHVIHSTGLNLSMALDLLEKQGEDFVQQNHYATKWLKLDVVTEILPIRIPDLSKFLGPYHEFCRLGVSLDSDFHDAFLEAELNGAKLWDYDKAALSLDYINRYQCAQNREKIAVLPENILLFSCAGWFFEGQKSSEPADDSKIIRLSDHGLTYGRRLVSRIDRPFVQGLLDHATNFLLSQLHEDGSFTYGMYPRFDKEIHNYNYVRHASTLWSLVLAYRLHKDPAIIPKIDAAIGYLFRKAVVCRDENTAYVVERKSQEIKLGGLAVTVVALAEYADAILRPQIVRMSNSSRIVLDNILRKSQENEVCKERQSSLNPSVEKLRALTMAAEALGNGILSMMDRETGVFTHVLNEDYSVKAKFRTVYYDGEAAFALTKLYELTKEVRWLTAAERAAQHFIEADYTQYKDHWIAYAMNEITRYSPRPEYYTFALRNAQVNLKKIYDRRTTYHTYLELLMVSFETYDRVVQEQPDLPFLASFDIHGLLRTIYCRADRMLNGYFFPEYAMYMKNPDCILGTFMVRHDGYRVRIDDVQHNIDGYYLYYENYNRMLQYGLLDAIKDGYGAEMT